MRTLVETNEAFDPANPYDAMAEAFRRQVTDMAIQAERATIYREMTPSDQLNAFIAGTMTGIVGVCLVSISPEGREEIMKVLADSLPAARRQAEAMIDD